MCVRKNAGLGCKSHGSVWENFFEATLLRTKTARSHGKENIFSTNGVSGLWVVGRELVRGIFHNETRTGLDMNFKLLPSADSLCYTYAHSISTACVKEGLRKLPYKASSTSLKHGEAKRIVGRTLDPEAAYKQMLVSEKSLWASVLSVEDPDGKQKLFLSHVLPFGAWASVYAFNKMAKALHVVGMRLFGLVRSQYFDDFPS